MAKKDRTDKNLYDRADWWMDSEDDPHVILDSVVKQISTEDSTRYDQYKRQYRAVDQDLTSIGDTADVPDETRLELNELSNVIETLQAQIYSNRVLPAIVPDGADFEVFERAKELSWFTEGCFEQNKVHEEIVPAWGMETLVCGTGFVKSSHKVNKDGTASVVLERTPVLDVFVDKIEARSGKPRCMYARVPMDRWAAYSKFGEDDSEFYGTADERKQAILKASVSDDLQTSSTIQTQGDQIYVWEAWRLPTGPDGEGGKHVIWIPGSCTLVSEGWSRDRFPFCKMKFGTNLFGFYGQSAVARLLPAQNAYNKMSQRIDECHDIMGVPRLIVKAGAGINKAHIDDVPGTIIEYEGSTAPQEWNATPITPDAYSERDGLPQRMRGLIGVSQFQSTMQLPTQLREASGKSLEAFEDAGDARHAMLHRSYESAIIDLADLIIDEAEYAESRGLKVVAKATMGRKSAKRIKFSDVKLDRETFAIKVLPISHLSRSFSARSRELKELRDDGMITPEEYARMSDMPDTGMEKELASSAETIIRKNITWMVKNGSYLPPLPFDNHVAIIKITTQYLNWYRVQGDEYDEQVVANLTRYALEAKRELDKLNGPPPPPPGPPMPPGPMMPPGPPMGPPDAGMSPPAPMGPPMPPGPPGPVMQ